MPQSTCSRGSVISAVFRPSKPRTLWLGGAPAYVAAIDRTPAACEAITILKPFIGRILVVSVILYAWPELGRRQPAHEREKPFLSDYPHDKRRLFNRLSLHLKTPGCPAAANIPRSQMVVCFTQPCLHDSSFPSHREPLAILSLQYSVSLWPFEVSNSPRLDSYQSHCYHGLLTINAFGVDNVYRHCC